MKPLEWILNAEAGLHSLKYLVVAVLRSQKNAKFQLQFWDVGVCVGYPLSSKSILKVVSQMLRLCDYATVLFSYLHIGFLTFLALLKNTFWDGTACIWNSGGAIILKYAPKGGCVTSKYTQ